MSDLAQCLAELDTEAAGASIHAFATAAFPICRSITGDGVRATLDLVRGIVPIDVYEIASGTEVFDWQIPPEWNVRDAWIRDPSGARVVDFRAHNLHLLGYSVPVHDRLRLEALRPHLYSLPEQPDVIPYRTSYYRERWGFCLPHRMLQGLGDGPYEVCVDSRLEAGHLTYGELVLPGASEETILISAHICHPSLANDNLSGVGVAAHLARHLAGCARRYTYRFLFIPGTIGSIAWLAGHRQEAAAIHAGLVAANLGDGGSFHYQRSRRGDSEVDRAVARVLEDAGLPFAIQDFVPFGYDERQFNSPGFALDVGLLSRTPWGRYREYHTSGDNLDFIRPEHLGISLGRYLEVIQLLETNRRYRNRQPFCEPQLGKRGLYRTVGGQQGGRERELDLLWVLNQSDGSKSLLDIAERAGRPFKAVRTAADALLAADLLEACDGAQSP